MSELSFKLYYEIPRGVREIVDLLKKMFPIDEI